MSGIRKKTKRSQGYYWEEEFIAELEALADELGISKSALLILLARYQQKNHNISRDDVAKYLKDDELTSKPMSKKEKSK